jgi:hypothetical protein
MTVKKSARPNSPILPSLVHAHCFILRKTSLTKASSRPHIGALRSMQFQKLTLAGNRQILTDVTKDALKAAPAFEHAGAIGRS